MARLHGRFHRKTDAAPGSQLITDAAAELMGPQLDYDTSSAISADFALYNSQFAVDTIQDGFAGWGLYHWNQFQVRGCNNPADPEAEYGMYAPGANYDHPKAFYSFAFRLQYSNPTLAQTFLTIANEWARIYIDKLTNYTAPQFGLPTYHTAADGVALHYLQTGDPISKTCLGGMIDLKMQGSVASHLDDPTSTEIDGREQGRRLNLMALAYHIDAPTAFGFGGSWAARGADNIPTMLNAIYSTWNYQPASGLTVDDRPRMNHPGRQGLAIHDYFSKSFMDTLINDGMMKCHRYCTFLNDSDRTAILNHIRANADWQIILWDDYHKTVPYPEALYDDDPGVGFTGEGCNAAPEGSNFYLSTFAWLYHMTGDTTYRDWIDRILHGSLYNPVFDTYTTPIYGTRALPKHVMEFYQGVTAAYYRQAAPLSTEVRPVNTVVPALSGTVSSGSLLTCSTGTWSNTPTSYSYRWISQRDNTVTTGTPYFLYLDQDPPFQVGIDANTYTLQASDVGKRIKCMVTASNASGASVNIPTLTTTVVV